MNNNSNTSTDPTLAALGGTDAGSSPEGGDNPSLAGLDALQADIARPRFSAQSILLVMVICVAGGVLYAMRQIGLGPGTAIAQDKEHDFKDLMGKGDHRGLLADLNASRTEMQVPEDKLKKNPFRMEGAATLADIVAQPGAPVDDSGARSAEAARAEAERRRLAGEARNGQVKQRFNQLQLNGVLGGSTPVARIGGKVYRVGDTVAEFFTLTVINQRSVVLECDGVKYDLAMETAEGKP